MNTTTAHPNTFPRHQLSLAISLVFTGTVTVANAADVQVNTPSGGNFAVKNNAGSTLLLQVQESGPVTIPNLSTASPSGTNGVCFGTGGVLVPCTSITGPQGPQGAQGSQGPQGTQGSTGAQGLTGAQGSQGAQGSTGAQGLTGTQGPQGTQGTQGSQGTQGTQGSAGAQGSTGAQGSAGAQGSTGAQGAQGAQGSTGAQGAQGAGLGANSFSTLTSFTNPGSGAANTTYYLSPLSPPPGSFTTQTAIADATHSNFIVAPVSCTMIALNMAASNYTSTPAADTITITVYKNLAVTTMTASAATNGNTTASSDTTHTFAVTAGDKITLAFTETNITPWNMITVKLTCQ